MRALGCLSLLENGNFWDKVSEGVGRYEGDFVLLMFILNIFHCKIHNTISNTRFHFVDYIIYFNKCYTYHN